MTMAVAINMSDGRLTVKSVGVMRRSSSRDQRRTSADSVLGIQSSHVTVHDLVFYVRWKVNPQAFEARLESSWEARSVGILAHTVTWEIGVMKTVLVKSLDGQRRI
jgi:hypothetical protein